MSKKRVVIVGAVLLLFLFVPSVLNSTYNARALDKINSEAQVYATKYNIDGPHNLGSTESCGTFSRTKFGITNNTTCRVTVAMLFYSEVTARGQAPAVPFETDYRGRQYQYVYYGNNLQPSNTSTRLAKKYLQPTNEGIDGQWVFTKHDNSGVDKETDILVKDIEDTLRADRSPGQNLPSTSVALKEGKAPLVVYYTKRYCESPNFIILDKLCVLPTYKTYGTD